MPSDRLNGLQNDIDEIETQVFTGGPDVSRRIYQVAQRQNDEITRLTEATYQQSEQVKRISSWAAVLFAPKGLLS